MHTGVTVPNSAKKTYRFTVLVSSMTASGQLQTGHVPPWEQVQGPWLVSSIQAERVVQSGEGETSAQKGKVSHVLPDSPRPKKNGSSPSYLRLLLPLLCATGHAGGKDKAPRPGVAKLGLQPAPDLVCPTAPHLGSDFTQPPLERRGLTPWILFHKAGKPQPELISFLQ
jgi:hypothetical protein